MALIFQETLHKGYLH